MKRLLGSVLIGMFFLSVGVCFADNEYVNSEIYYKPSLLDKIEDATQDFGDATADAARKTGNYIKDKSKTAASATNKAVKSGAKKTGEAVKSGAKKAGCATKKGAKKATNWSATKVRDGAEKVILKTEDVNQPNVQPSQDVDE